MRGKRLKPHCEPESLASSAAGDARCFTELGRLWPCTSKTRVGNLPQDSWVEHWVPSLEGYQHFPRIRTFGVNVSKFQISTPNYPLWAAKSGWERDNTLQLPEAVLDIDFTVRINFFEGGRARPRNSR